MLDQSESRLVIRRTNHADARTCVEPGRAADRVYGEESFHTWTMVKPSGVASYGALGHVPLLDSAILFTTPPPHP